MQHLTIMPLILLHDSLVPFCSDYNNHTDLHIAITNSSGVIVEFDRNGLKRHCSKNYTKQQWEQSLLVESVPEAWFEHWDDVLLKVQAFVGIVHLLRSSRI